jgi:hypothetical protein
MAFCGRYELLSLELRRIPPMTETLDLLVIAGSALILLDFRPPRSHTQAVLALPARYREAIVLFYFHEMDISAAARSLALPEALSNPALRAGKS